MAKRCENCEHFKGERYITSSGEARSKTLHGKCNLTDRDCGTGYGGSTCSKYIEWTAVSLKKAEQKVKLGAFATAFGYVKEKQKQDDRIAELEKSAENEKLRQKEFEKERLEREREQIIDQQFQCGKYSCLDDKRCATCENFNSQREIVKFNGQTVVESAPGFCNTAHKDKGSITPETACESWMQWGVIIKEKARAKVELEREREKEREEEKIRAEKQRIQIEKELKEKEELERINNINKKYGKILLILGAVLFITAIILINQFSSLWYFVALNNIEKTDEFTAGIIASVIKIAIFAVCFVVEIFIFYRNYRKRKEELNKKP